MFIDLLIRFIGEVFQLLYIFGMMFDVFGQLLLHDHHCNAADHGLCGLDVLALIEHEADMRMRQEHRWRTRRDQHRMEIDANNRIEMLDSGKCHGFVPSR
ncbi:hypothetical protein AQ475_23540 [Burkholderia thailandensis]|nr:hypothetical protein AQ475_23540 [Burkholderia thailandensis]